MTASGDTAARTRWTTYLVLGVIFLLLAGTALAVFRSAESNAAAEQKADQLISELTAAGLPAPSKDQIVQVLGDDGGATCSDPNNGLTRGILLGELANGAGGPGTRPVIADNTVVQGQLLVLKVYCPDELQAFADFVNDLKFDDVAKG
jgi:Tfp pilus assembly protein FimT